MTNSIKNQNPICTKRDEDLFKLIVFMKNMLEKLFHK